MLNPNFNRLLKLRALTVRDVAKQIFSNTKAVVLVLGNPTWRKLAAVLTKDEYDCARNFVDQRRKAAAAAREVCEALRPVTDNQCPPDQVAVRRGSCSAKTTPPSMQRGRAP